MDAVGKTIWNNDAEDSLIETGLYKQGTANKGFASVRDYYQIMCEHKLLREAMAYLHTDAFEQWHQERNDDAQLSGLADDFQNICDTLCILQNDGSNTNETRILLTPYSNYIITWVSTMKKARSHLHRSSVEPSARRLAFLSGPWHLTVQAIGKTLVQSNNMLPFVVAAGHHNYIYSLSLCLKEMNNLKDPTQNIYQYFTKGIHGVRKKLGHSKVSLLIWLMGRHTT